MTVEKLVVWGSEMAEYVSRFGIRNVGWIVEVRADFARGNFEISKWDFQQVLIVFQQDFSSIFQWIYRWLKLAHSAKCSYV